MNLYWPIYKRIEAEVEHLTSSILFSDDQLAVYSMDIATLIIRCSIEVEAISKELYLQLGGIEKPVDKRGKKRDLYFDTDCMKMLVDKWHIDKKEVIICSPNMYFSETNRILMPLQKSHKRGKSKWGKAYQAIKHNRSKSMKMATVENLLNALGALYILNLYYRDESFWYGSPMENRRDYNEMRDSIIFSPQIYDATHITMACDMGDSKNEKIEDSTLEKAIYVIKFREDAFRSIHEAMCSDNLRAVLAILKSAKYKEYIQQNPEEKDTDIFQTANKIGVDVDVNKYIIHGDFAKAFSQVHNHQEVILNKHHAIYPELRYDEYISADTTQMRIKEMLEQE